jgi:hypothetical protein
VPASTLIEQVASLIDEFTGRLTDPLDADLRALGQRLREPMRVAVVGRVKAGKSTVVNALLGQRVAPTDVSECTRLVTWFRYGYPQRLVVELRNGRRLDAQLTPAGMLPDTLPVPAAEVASLQAFLTNDVLKDLIIIDTPGIGSVHEEYSAATSELIELTASSNAATAQADAVLFLLNQVVMEDEHAVLQKLAQAGEQPGSAANTVGVLSKADKLGDGESDPWQVALDLATRYSERFTAEVAAVVPVVGLLAETAETAALTETDARHLAALAGLDPLALEPLLWSADRFVEGDAPVGRAERERLLALLDLYGIERALAYAREGDSSATRLRQRLAGLSGIAEVRRAVTSLFNAKDDVLKVRSVLDLLYRLSYRNREGADPRLLLELRSKVEGLRLDPSMHRVAELEAWHAVCSGKITLPEALRLDLQRLVAPASAAARLGVGEGDPDAMRQAAIAAMNRWRAFMVSDADPAQAGLARVVLRSFQLAHAAAGDPPIASVQSSTGAARSEASGPTGGGESPGAAGEAAALAGPGAGGTA